VLLLLCLVLSTTSQNPPKIEDITEVEIISDSSGSGTSSGAAAADGSSADAKKSSSKVDKKKKKKNEEVKNPKKKSIKDWAKFKAEDLEKEWEDGDDPELLLNEYEYQQQVNRKRQGSGFDPLTIRETMKKNPFSVMGGSGTKMVFVDLKEKQPDGSKWDKRATDKLASKWQHLVKTGSLTANVFNIEDGKLLISIDKSYMFGDIMKFCFNQIETEKISIDSKEYFAKDYKDKDDDE